MVERFNRSLLQLLRSYVDRYDNWERYLPLILYAYRTSVHSSTGASPFILMYGRQPKTDLSHAAAFDALSYPAHLRAKLAELRDFVETNLIEAAQHQKSAHDQHAISRTLVAGDCVWLSVPTAGKLEPRWEGGWKISMVKGPVTMEITDGERTKVVHVNRIRRRLQPMLQEQPASDNQISQPWNPPWVDHHILPRRATELPSRRYPQRERRPPDRYGIGRVIL